MLLWPTLQGLLGPPLGEMLGTLLGALLKELPELCEAGEYLGLALLQTEKLLYELDAAPASVQPPHLGALAVHAEGRLTSSH